MHSFRQFNFIMNVVTHTTSLFQEQCPLPCIALSAGDLGKLPSLLSIQLLLYSCALHLPIYSYSYIAVGCFLISKRVDKACVMKISVCASKGCCLLFPFLANTGSSESNNVTDLYYANLSWRSCVQSYDLS